MNTTATYPENPAASAEEKLFDLSMISNVCRGNEAAIHKMIHVFIRTVPATVDEMKASLLAGDYEQLQQLAHRVKPTMSMYAIVKLEKDVHRIDRMQVDTLTAEELGHMMGKIERVIGAVTAELKKIVNH